MPRVMRRSYSHPRELSPGDAEVLRAKTRQATLAVVLVVAGSANTITCKLAFNTQSRGLYGPELKPFEHPYVMTSCLFLGEIGCLLVFRLNQAYTGRSGGHTKKHLPGYAFALPACCDLIGTSITYIGLTMTTASTYQMLRGSVIIFTGLISSVYLKRKQMAFHWVGMLLVVAGAAVVGLASMLQAGQVASASSPLFGNFLVVFSQLFTALQMCLEERFVAGYNVPALVAVGNEGIWGLLGLCCSLAVLQRVTFAGGQPVENSVEAFVQVCNNPQLLILMAANALSVAFFNYSGVSVTKSSSASYRMVIDSLRTVVIWVFDLALGGAVFHPLQVVGFGLTLTGASVYNEMFLLPYFAYPSGEDRVEEQLRQRQKHSLQQPFLSFTPSPNLKVDDFFTPSLSRFTFQKQ